MNEYDADENRVLSDTRSDIICPSGQPWELPEFSAEEARAIGDIAGRLVESGEWEEIEKRILANVGKISLQ